MIRAILHLTNDQPLSVELTQMPTPGDIAIVCTNLRTIDGKKPVFIDFATSTFVFPMSHIRFVEVLQAADDANRSAANLGVAGPDAEADEAEDLEIDEDFLRRVREA